jgi:hypothetical protein
VLGLKQSFFSDNDINIENIYLETCVIRKKYVIILDTFFEMFPKDPTEFSRKCTSPLLYSQNQTPTLDTG